MTCTCGHPYGRHCSRCPTNHCMEKDCWCEELHEQGRIEMGVGM